MYRLSDKELLVLVTEASGKIRVRLATDQEEPLTLRWALSERAGEWLAPSGNLLPAGSTSVDKGAETQFSTISIDGSNNKIQRLELEIQEGSFMGMPFVLLCGENWVKNNDSDFYVEFGGPKKVMKVTTL